MLMLMKALYNFIGYIYVTHRYAAYVQIYFISSALSFTLFHTDVAVFLITWAICPVAILKE